MIRERSNTGRDDVTVRISDSSGHWAVLLAAPLALAGCMVGPHYVSPEEKLAPFHNTLVAPANAAAPASLDEWWTGFNDPLLTKVVQRALDQNLDLAASFARVKQARAAARAAGAELLPTLDLEAAGTVQRQSADSPGGRSGSRAPGYDRNQQEYTVGGVASWEIDLAGGNRRQAAAARLEVEAAKADQVGTRIIVAADAADAYLTIRGLQTRIAVTAQQVQIEVKLVELLKFRRSQGVAAEREVAEGEALVRQARALLPPLRMSLEAQLNRLDVLMGVQPGTYARDLDAVAPIPSIPAIGDDRQPLDVLRRRPDVIAAERRLAASSERIGAALSDYYPKISLAGALGLDSVSTGSLFTSGAFQPVGTGALHWRLFDFGRVDAEVKQARGANAEALAIYRESVLRAAEDVENALSTLSQTQIRIIELQGAVDALERSRQLSERAYKAGSIPLTDVLVADRELLVARGDLGPIRADAARAAVGAYRSLGGGWSPSGAKLAPNTSRSQ